MNQLHSSAFPYPAPQQKYGRPLDGLVYQPHDDVSEMAHSIYDEAALSVEFNNPGKAI